MSEAGIEKSAALLLALGEEATAAVFRYLSPLDVSRLGQAMRALEVLPRERVRTVLHEFSREAAGQTGFAADTALSSVDLPALGKLTRPTSANSFSSKTTAFSIPG